MRVPVSDQALVQLLLESKRYTLTSLARELDLHRNTLARILDGSSQATHKTSMCLLGFYLSHAINLPIDPAPDLELIEIKA